jgi:penicillin-binding protein 2
VSKGWRQRGLPRLTSIRWPSWRASRRARITERRGPSLPNPLAAPEDVGSRPDVRLWVVGAVFAVLFAFMGVRLAFLQLADHAAYAATVQTNTLRTVSIPAPRGQIVAREGTKLVANTVHQELVLSRLQASSVPGLVGRVAALAGIPVNQVVAALANVQYSPYQPVPILTDTPTKVIIYLEEHRSMFPGVSVETLTERTYPAGGDLAPQVLGYVGPITADQYAQLASKGGYTPNSTIGQDGVEEYYDQYLRGIAGTQEIEVDASGDPIQTIVNRPPVTGDTVVLNLDAPLQSFLSNALAEDILRVRSTLDPRSGRYPPAPNGAAVVLDPRNGHVLAMASYPSYNLDVWKGGISAPSYASLLRSTALNNNVTGGLYTPGSTFKLVTATAALQDHLISPAQYVDDTGKFTIPNCVALHNAGCSFRDDEVTGLGEVDLPLAITESSDYYFYNLGYQFWNDYTNIAHYRYGETPIQDVATAYGLTAPTGVDLPGESSSIVDSPQVRLAEYKQYPKLYPNYQWFTGDNIEMAFGQGGTVLTPLGLANAYATFANGGKRFQPEVAAAVVSAQGSVVQLYGPKVTGKVSLPPSVRGPILQGLLGVVNDPSGTAYATFHSYTNFNLSSFPIAGKTGTASNVAGEEPNSWFVGFGPVDHARYVVLCVIAQGGYGADAAAPVVAQTFNYLVQHPVGALHLSLTHHAVHHGQTGPVTTTTTKP